ncbi:MAG: hypothetical protein U0W40_10490 [Acidimicrobiia bacterium]
MSGVIERTVDVAGVPVRLRAPDLAPGPTPSTPTSRGFRDHRRAGRDAAGGRRRGAARRRARTSPDDELDDFRYWRAADGMVVARHDLVLHGDGDQVTAYQPDADDLWWLEEMVAFALTWVLARRARFVLHGAVVAATGRHCSCSGRRARQVDARGGAGSRLGAPRRRPARRRHLGRDDHPAQAGFHHSPAIPREIGGPVTEAGTVLDDPRDRAELPRSVLATGGRTLVGVVLVAHSDRADGEVVPAARPTAFALILQSFAATSDPALREPIFRAAGELVQRPCFELRHALDPAHRRARAGVHLDEILAAIAAGEGEAGDLADPDDDGGVVSPGG